MAPAFCKEVSNMKFKDDDGKGDPVVSPIDFPTEYPHAIVVQDLEGAFAKMFIITRTHVYRMDPVTFAKLIEQYAEGRVENDSDNAPNLESVRAAVTAFKGLIQHG
jgi:hypothetical protein